MSVYTLVGFVAFTALLGVGGKVANEKFNQQEAETEKVVEAINGMKIEMAVMATSLKNIENDGKETRTAIAEINRTLMDKLT